jgi:signal transduction histidine kinase
MGLLWAVGNHSIRGLTEDFVISRLEHDAESLLAALLIDAGQTRVRWRRIDQIYSQPLSGHYYVVRLDNGNELTSRSLWDQTMPSLQLDPGESRHLHTSGPADQQLLVWIKGYKKQGHKVTIAVAEDLSSIQAERDRFMRTFALLAFAGLVLMLGIQRLAVRRSFRRLEPLRDDIRQLEQGRTDKLSEDVPTEILPLVQEFNHLLSLLAQRLERSRNALGNLAHALKGPLNLLMQYFDAQGPTAQNRREMARAQVERIRQLMERELKRARLAGTSIQSQHFEAASELPDLIGVLQQVYQQRRLKIDYTASLDLPAFGDREDMLELLGNLLDNACKWAASRVLCQITGGDNIHIVVADDGNGLSDDDLTKLAQRGIRLDESVEGHGLGLAISKDIVKLYTGSISFHRSSQLGGLEVRISLPMQPNPQG